MADRICAKLPSRIAKRSEGLIFRVVDKDVPVGKEQDFGLAMVAPFVPTC